MGYVLIKDINSGWLVANVWHNAQYILFVWLYNTNRFKNDAVDGTAKVSVMSWLSQRKPIRVLSYFIFTLIMTTIFYQSITEGFKLIAGTNLILLSSLYIVGYQTVNFHHYIVDSLIWKAKNKKNQKALNVAVE